MRVVQTEGRKGSLKWIQRAVNRHPEVLNRDILPALGIASSLTWLSPLKTDDYAEYRDADALKQLGAEDLAPALAVFWPSRGPQWDALARSSKGDLLLVEAKAHVRELFSPPTQASPASRLIIEAALKETAAALGAEPKGAWTETFYQYATRLAHLAFLRRHERPAWLVLVSFIGDSEVGGPETAEAWHAAYAVMDAALGLQPDHVLARYILHIHPNVRELG